MSQRPPDPGPRPDRLLLLITPLLVLILLVFIVLWIRAGSQSRPVPPGVPRQPGPEARRPLPVPSPTEGYLFCTWNVENLFDDHDDPKSHDEDEDWFGRNPAMVHRKVKQLADALLRMNSGRGPDILAIVEVENRRAVEILRNALNARLPTELRYDGLFHRDNLTGRRIEPALLTRLEPASDRPPRTRGRRVDAAHDFGTRRILEARLEAEGAPLTVIVSHWTSRVTDNTDAKRSAYADAIYAAVLNLYARDPAVDVILSGDFNDEPGNVSVSRHLRAVADPARVRASDPTPNLLDLMAGRDPKVFGTYLYGRHWRILDHIVATPGLLDDRGWQVLPGTLRVANDAFLRSHRDQRPFRFGGPDQKTARGYSDHFAVTVRLRVVLDGPLQ